MKKETPFGNFEINKEVRKTIFGDIELLNFKKDTKKIKKDKQK